ncbi:gonadotropin-releasing hormone II receptor-like [Lytechinus variegatus]|uniref:gonadotropin-releasing hormone II receptor-like n=1 Tax=Lytechinus variegatus TaxID=7654 RepID=UPI001BB189BD|nr:gonadotropin-releasing hormone II receptor-like [Lytechinus variegatus]
MASPTSHRESDTGMNAEWGKVGGYAGADVIIIAPTLDAGMPYNYSFNDSIDASGNETDFETPVFTPEYLIRVVTLTSIMVLSGPLNLAVFVSLWRQRRPKSRINLLIMHLAVADLLITFVNIPTDVIWFCTVRWLAGNVMCKLLMFIESGAMYASSFVLIVISLDRFAAIVHPLSVSKADRRCKIMLRVAWSSSVVCSVPQLFVHEVGSPPQDPSFTQCVDYTFANSHRKLWWSYHVFVTLAMYVIPLIAIFSCYAAIVYKICKQSREVTQALKNGNHPSLRRTGLDRLPRARMKALRLTATIVTAFIICWSPYYIVSTWYHFDSGWQSTEKKMLKPEWLIDVLMALGYSNICADPIIYGLFSTKLWRQFRRCWKKKSLREYRSPKMATKRTLSSSHSTVTRATSLRFGVVTSVHACPHEHPGIEMSHMAQTRVDSVSD